MFVGVISERHFSWSLIAVMSTTRLESELYESSAPSNHDWMLLKSQDTIKALDAHAREFSVMFSHKKWNEV